ncbi:YSIRK-type signal peptide-containing protein, partial [Lactobacillus sp. XV13L]|nr:YSIRK-type signal peptide-containing protein [Lactobacillus sp. XV13L]
MLGKNNFKERLRKMEMQAKRDRFSIRNLSVGAASVLLGFAFFGLDGHSVKADAVNPST